MTPNTPFGTATVQVFEIFGTLGLGNTRASDWRPFSASTNPLSAEAEDIAVEFSRLAEEWRRDVSAASSISRRVSHAAYRAIVGLGMPVVGLLINDLRAGRYYWLEALREIVADGPVIEAADRGNRHAIACAWIEWGRKSGY